MPCYQQHTQSSDCVPAKPQSRPDEQRETPSTAAAAASDASDATAPGSLPGSAQNPTFGLPASAIEAIRNSERLRLSLENPQLRQIITYIDSAPTDAHRVAALSDELERNPEFTQFVYDLAQTMKGLKSQHQDQ